MQREIGFRKLSCVCCEVPVPADFQYGSRGWDDTVMTVMVVMVLTLAKDKKRV